MGKTMNFRLCGLLATVLVLIALMQTGGPIHANALAPRPRRHREKLIVKVIPISSVDVSTAQVSNGGDVDFSVTFESQIAVGDSVNIQVSLAPVGGSNISSPWLFTVNGTGSSTYHIAHQIGVDGEFKLSADTFKLDMTLLGNPKVTLNSVCVAQE